MGRWFVNLDGELLGPLTSSEFRQLVVSGRIQKSTQVSTGDASKWLPAGRIPGLFESEDALEADSPPAKRKQERSRATAANSTSEVASQTTPGKQRMHYKVLTQKDKWFSGKFDPERLEEALNAYAQQGWVLKAATSASIQGIMSGTRDEMVLILERRA